MNASRVKSAQDAVASSLKTGNRTSTVSVVRGFMGSLGGVAFATAAVICLTLTPNAMACKIPGAPGRTTGSFPNTSAITQAASVPAGEAHDAAAPPIPARSGGNSVLGGVQGLWQVNFISGGQTVDMAFEVFHSDGTEMINDITPPAEGNVCLGVYVQTDRTTYKLTHPSWTFDASGNLTGTGMFSETINMTNADKFTGSYTLNYFDTNANPVGTYNGTFTATRILPNY